MQISGTNWVRDSSLSTLMEMRSDQDGVGMQMSGPG